MADEQLESLVSELQQDNAAYRAGRPRVTDAEYDAKVEQLRALDPEHPYLHAVEAEDAAAFAGDRVRHETPMLSTEKVKSADEVDRFIDRVLKAADELGLPRNDVVFRVTPKLDGLAGRDDGRRLVTRGNGLEGYDITRAFDRGVVPVGGRGLGLGELVVHQPYFEAFLAGEFKHPRNFMVGLTGADELNPAAQAALEAGAARFVPYSQVEAWEGSVQALRADLRTIEQDIWEHSEYKLDGVVIEIVDPELRQALGATSHHNRWQVALKPVNETARTALRSVAWQTGRTGQVTPVLIIDPVCLSGATISRLTAHHAGVVRDQKLGPGAEIVISRAGFVIPKLEQVIEGSAEASVPDACPCCGEPLAWDNDFLRCENDVACEAQQAAKIIHFFSTMGNADLFGPKTVDRVVAAGHTRLEGIYALTRRDFLQLGFGPGQAKNLVAQLERSRVQPVEDWRFLAALGIRNLGRGDSRKLLQHVRLEDLGGVTPSTVLAIHGFGPKTAPQIARDIVARWPTIEHMLDLGFALIRSPLASEKASVQSPIAGKGIVFTGTMASSGRAAMEGRARDLGANVQKAVSGRTDYLVCGDKVGASKTGKAEKLGVTVLSEAAYLELIAGPPTDDPALTLTQEVTTP